MPAIMCVWVKWQPGLNWLEAERHTAMVIRSQIRPQLALYPPRMQQALLLNTQAL